MANELTRRDLLGAMGVAAAGAVVSPSTAKAADVPKARGLRILGICCSPRKGKTTAAALQVCLEAARKVDPGIETELIELAGMNIPVFDPAAPADKETDFQKLAPKLTDPKVAGIIIGTPVYFSGMTSLCKAFLDHCMVFRKGNFALRNKVAGVVAVGGVRNGGQELAIGSVQAALMCQEMILVGDGRPSAHTGATVLNDGKDDISGDDFGLASARNLGARVAEVALLTAGAGK